MNRKKKILVSFVKGWIWCAGFCFIFAGVTKVLQPKYYFTSASQSPETEMWKNFYQEPKDSLVVLFLGSSHVYNGIHPIVFYEKTGLTGFDLSSSSQDLPTSYYFLKEALRFQKPKHVIMDPYGVFYEAFSNTVCYKRSLDDMRWSKVKVEACKDWQEYLPEEKMFSRFFTIHDYHGRWENLTKEDYQEDSMVNHNGYCPYFDSQADVAHVYYKKDAVVPDLDEKAMKYFEKIIKLCEKESISLILCSVPDTTWSINHTNKIKNIAETYEIAFIDYNVDEIYAQLGIIEEQDWKDVGHLNAYGAEKFTRYMAMDFLEKGLIEKENIDNNPFWREKVKKWNHAYKVGISKKEIDEE